VFNMGWGEAISNISGIFDKWMKGSRGRARRQLQDLKNRKKRILSQPPNKRQVENIIKIDRKIKEMESYLKDY